MSPCDQGYYRQPVYNILDAIVVCVGHFGKVSKALFTDILSRFVHDIVSLSRILLPHIDSVM